MPLKILLADDSMNPQTMGKKILTDAGYEVTVVSNGAAAVKKIAEVKPDICILDVFMPGYTGVEVTEKLRADKATAAMPVLLTVGKMELGGYNVADGRRVNAEGLVIKPFEASDLLAAVQKLAAKVDPSLASPAPANSSRAYEKTIVMQRPAVLEEFKDESYAQWKSEAEEEPAEDAATKSPNVPAAMAAASAFTDEFLNKPTQDGAYEETIKIAPPKGTRESKNEIDLDGDSERSAPTAVGIPVAVPPPARPMAATPGEIDLDSTAITTAPVVAAAAAAAASSAPANPTIEFSVPNATAAFSASEIAPAFDVADVSAAASAPAFDLSAATATPVFEASAAAAPAFEIATAASAFDLGSSEPAAAFDPFAAPAAEPVAAAPAAAAEPAENPLGAAPEAPAAAFEDPFALGHGAGMAADPFAIAPTGETDPDPFAIASAAVHAAHDPFAGHSASIPAPAVAAAAAPALETFEATPAPLEVAQAPGFESHSAAPVEATVTPEAGLESHMAATADVPVAADPAFISDAHESATAFTTRFGVANAEPTPAPEISLIGGEAEHPAAALEEVGLAEEHASFEAGVAAPPVEIEPPPAEMVAPMIPSPKKDPEEEARLLAAEMSAALENMPIAANGGNEAAAAPVPESKHKTNPIMESGSVVEPGEVARGIAEAIGSQAGDTITDRERLVRIVRRVLDREMPTLLYQIMTEFDRERD